ncbi:DUF3055 domain-containing protein [Ferroacidibacillus organovorans]|uniref:Cytosolic protein n=1 Tax=Ferroacidibacillus organovorans TaxID=1765683 RepID=A0A101XQ65_9BACL|nr:DUF3055 domain-containing protein [Ferroacidibacillus organovorans]KUO95537.1 hypothetical protein ATW55_06515 [Ferroacidibacillus organovorans]
MIEEDVMYDEQETTETRFIGILGQVGRYDLAITKSTHFFGKSLVTNLTNGRSGVLDREDCENVELLMHVFHVNVEEASELSAILPDCV